MIKKYLDNTMGRSLKLQSVWAVDRHGEDKRFAAHDKLGNRKLLWHGLKEEEEEEEERRRRRKKERKKEKKSEEMIACCILMLHVILHQAPTSLL